MRLYLIIIHPHEQVGTVISGEFEMTIGKETRWLKQGDTYIIPGGVEHGARTGNRAATVLDILNPVREDTNIEMPRLLQIA